MIDTWAVAVCCLKLLSKSDERVRSARREKDDENTWKSMGGFRLMRYFM